MPLVDGKSCCQGRRKTAVSRAGDNVVAFFVRWTRSDFWGCTRYTQCGSEGVLGRGWWTWYRPSKWTWSTAVPKAGGSRCVCQDRGLFFPEMMNYCVALAAGSGFYGFRCGGLVRKLV